MKNYMMIVIINLIIIGCAIYEPLPGLCYTDKTGTYVCPKEEPYLISRDLQCVDYGMIEYCVGTHKDNMTCHCVNHNDMNDTTDFLWNL